MDIRFIDTKENESDHPWRMRYTLDANNVVFDGGWQHLQIPLENFTEHGSWDNDTWYVPEGKFDWAAIDRFEIVSEYGNMGSTELWFDDIKILNPNAATVADEDLRKINFELLQNYPNPFNPSTTLSFVIGHSLLVSLKIFDILGNEIKNLLNEEKPAGKYEIFFNAKDLPSGIYFYRIAGGQIFADT